MTHTNKFQRFTARFLSLLMVLTVISVTVGTTISIEASVGYQIKSSGSEITIGGVIENVYNFELGGSEQEYSFSIDNIPDGSTCAWSLTGTLPAGLSLMGADTPNAYIGGTPTKTTDGPVSLTVSVRVIVEGGTVYEGSANIKIEVYEPVNPFAAAALIQKTDCTVSMTTANTKSSVSNWLNNTWLSSVAGLEAALGMKSNIANLSVKVNNDFIAALSGTQVNPNGTGGSITFSVKYNEIIICQNLTCTVKATDYSDTNNFTSEYSHESTCHQNESTALSRDAVSEKATHSETDEGNSETDVKEEYRGGSPQTGDNSNVVLWIALLFASGGAVMVLAVTNKKQEK